MRSVTWIVETLNPEKPMVESTLKCLGVDSMTLAEFESMSPQAIEGGGAEPLFWGGPLLLQSVIGTS